MRVHTLIDSRHRPWEDLDTDFTQARRNTGDWTDENSAVMIDFKSCYNYSSQEYQSDVDVIGLPFRATESERNERIDIFQTANVDS